MVWTDQWAPFQRSAKVRPEDLPTAVQAVGDMHDTALRLVSAAAVEVGVVWIDQPTPSHCSASVKRVPERLSDDPTALHAVVDAHDTPDNMLSLTPGGVGVVWIDQPTPSHRSTNAAPLPALSTKDPTAVQAVDDVHDTPLS